MASPSRVLVCRCAYSEAVGPEVVSAVVDALRAAGTDLTVVDDLCGLAARRDPELRRFAAAGEVAVVACHPRAVKWLSQVSVVSTGPTIAPPSMRSLDFVPANVLSWS